MLHQILIFFLKIGYEKTNKDFIEKISYLLTFINNFSNDFRHLSYIDNKI